MVGHDVGITMVTATSTNPLAILQGSLSVPRPHFENHGSRWYHNSDDKINVLLFFLFSYAVARIRFIKTNKSI